MCLQGWLACRTGGTTQQDGHQGEVVGAHAYRRGQAVLGVRVPVRPTEPPQLVAPRLPAGLQPLTTGSETSRAYAEQPAAPACAETAHRGAGAPARSAARPTGAPPAPTRAPATPPASSRKPGRRQSRRRRALLVLLSRPTVRPAPTQRLAPRGGAADIEVRSAGPQATEATTMLLIPRSRYRPRGRMRSSPPPACLSAPSSGLSRRHRAFPVVTRCWLTRPAVAPPGRLCVPGPLLPVRQRGQRCRWHLLGCAL